jgi:cell wall-associated NlpC family hydrolase
MKSRPVFVWWDTSQKREGHVGVYIGGGLFVDAYVGYELAKLTAAEMNAVTDPSRWSWSVLPQPQKHVPWPEGHWPRQRVNDGFSTVRVRGA